ncbi:inositol polyphosphate kinase family protein [Streptomyces sp. NPDC048291]|uniref:inositol polyphosphate kinase family protein n=1 Tax=Streptomyces sp. NPDC048291 TaxID=3365530 RepID=UPI00371E8DA7
MAKETKKNEEIHIELGYGTDEEQEQEQQKKEAKSAGGHGDLQFLGADRQIVQKPAGSHNTENEFYERVRNGEYPAMQGVVPQTYTAEQVRNALQNDLDDTQKAALDDKKYVYMENIANVQQKKVLDMKIGSQTTSYRDNTEQQGKSAPEAVVKSIKLKFFDIATGSATRNWRVVAGDDANSNRTLAGMKSEKILSKFSDDPAVWQQMVDKMKGIRDAVKTTDIGLVASSVFTVSGKDKTDGNAVVDAKLIDFAHVIDDKKPFEVTNEGAKMSGAKDKFRDNFVQGMDSLIKTSEKILVEKQTAAAASLVPAGSQNLQNNASSSLASTSGTNPVPVLPTNNNPTNQLS